MTGGAADAGGWTRAQVHAVAPDHASMAAAERLAATGSWTATGARDGVLWGSVRGSGQTPYAVMVRPAGPAFRCSCPSRKTPCKHALALLLRWTDDGLADAEPPASVAEWAAAASRPRRRTARSTQPREDTAARRAERVRLGLDELDVWLADQVRGGLAGLQRSGYGPVDQVAARMVDAQAPGVAGLLRALPSRYVGEGWPARLLEALAMVRLLVVAHRRLDELPADLAATVRSRVGYPTTKESVLATPPVRDRWAVLGLVDTVDELSATELTTRRVWLRGERTGRWVLLLSHAVGGAAPDSSVLPGVRLDADVHLYPGAGQHRGLLGTEHDRTDGVGDVPSVGVAEAAGLLGDLLALDPWGERLPVVLRGAPLPPESDGGRWSFRGEDGAAVPMSAGVEAWPLLARSMGDPVEVFGEWSRGGFLPVGVLPHPLDPVFSLEVLGR